MSTLILKFMLCSITLYAAYHFLLSTEKMLKFNRFFLLSILVCSMVFPTIITKTEYIEIPVQESIYTEVDRSAGAMVNESMASSIPAAPVFTISTNDVLWTIYSLVSLFFIIRFSRNLWQIQQLKKGGELTKKDGLQFCLREDIQASFTFLSTIYLNKTDYETGQIPSEIIDHEAVHAKQKHSIDIIFIEALQCLLWFNPVIYLIKNAIKMNHEYLADARVCEAVPEISQYQKTLIQYVYNSKQQPVLASQLTFGQTKNRLNMMVKNLQIRSAALRIILTTMVLAATLYGFGENRVIAQEQERANQTEVKTKEPQKKKLPTIIQIPMSTQPVRFMNEDREWIEKPYGELTRSQKERFRVPGADPQVFIAPEPEKVLSSTLFNELKDEKKYGIWVDGQRIQNETISRFSKEDFHHYKLSKLRSGAKNYGVHEYQIDLVTKKTFENTAAAKGRWIPYLGRLNSKEPEKKEPKNIPPPPPPRRVQLGHMSQVKYISNDENEIKAMYGELSQKQKDRFKSAEGKGQIFLPPPPPAFIDQEFLKKYANGEYQVWIDDQKINSADLLDYQPEDFYLYSFNEKARGTDGQVVWTGIRFSTKKNFDNSGVWVPFERAFLPQIREVKN